MNSRLLAAFAALLLVGAVVAGYLGYRMSTGDAASHVAVSGKTEDKRGDGRIAVVVAKRDVAAGTALAAEDTDVEYLRLQPPGSYDNVNLVLGSKPWMDIKAGSIITLSHFQSGGQLARLIRPDERAVAIAVDDVVGGGGFLNPGDYVDVLVFIRENQAGSTRETAQVVLPALRLLSYGSRMSRPNGDPGQEKKEANEDGRSPRTAVLAVPEKFTTRLMLASNAGNLRLAVRSADAGFHERYLSGQSAESIVGEEIRHLISLSALTPHAPSLRAAVQKREEPVEAVTVYRGKEIQRIIQ